MKLDDLKEIRMYYPMSLQEVFSRLPGYTPESVAGSYKRWVPDFYRKVSVFTNVRRALYERLQWDAFCKENGQDPNSYCAETEQAERLWELFHEKTGMGRHLRQIRNYQQSISAMISGTDWVVDQALSDKLFAIECYADSFDQPTEKLVFNSPDDFYAMWFNSHIDNTSHTVKELKALPYDEYLKTPHWRTVRDAMIMLHGCRCQGAECDMMGDSGYGGAESMIHVHHKNYKNRGNERFEDLTLLCDQCHRLEHGITA